MTEMFPVIIRNECSGQATTASTITCIPNSALAIQSSALCGTGSQTTEHLLQSCPTYEPLRKGIWPDHTPVSPQDVRKPEGLAMHCHLHRGDWSFHLTNEKKMIRNEFKVPAILCFLWSAFIWAMYPVHDSDLFTPISCTCNISEKNL